MFLILLISQANAGQVALLYGWLSSSDSDSCRFHPTFPLSMSLSLLDVWEKGGSVANNTNKAVPGRKHAFKSIS